MALVLYGQLYLDCRMDQKINAFTMSSETWLLLDPLMSITVSILTCCR